jgi:sodium-dependent dicarboxylate transporter 2/3/5
MMMGIPLSVLFLASGWLLLTRLLFPFPATGLFGKSSLIDQARRALGPIRRDEWVSAAVFAVVAMLWISGEDVRLGDWNLPGWRSQLGLPMFGDAAVAIAGASLLFAIPSQDHPGEALLTWKQSAAVPWGLLLLFGGGFALAAGFQASGLSAGIGTALTGLSGTHPVLLVVIVCIVITFLTEVTSNTATTALILPILAEASVAMKIDPLLLMIPATLSASCAFMMPVASPTQAIVFGSGYVPIRQMVRAGIGFNLLGIFWVSLIFLLLAQPVFGVAW